MKKLILPVVISLLLSGCGSFLKSEYQRPELIVPTGWQTTNSGTAWAQHSPHWWALFNDSQLTQMINDMLRSNNDLAAAGIRLQQARLDSSLADTNLTPDVTVSGEANNSKNLRKNTAANESYSSSIGLSYELDLWGKLASTREQAEWTLKATALDRQNTALTLIGTTAQYYWQIASLNQKMANSLRSIELAQQTEEIARSRFQSGYVSQLDVVQAQQTVLVQKNSYRDLVQQRTEARNALAILFNRPPAMHQPERSGLDVTQSIPFNPDVPLSVIGRRPDVQSAEWQLRAALAGSDVAKLGFYPTLSLSATFGAGSSLFREWFSNPTRALGTSLALPFIQWNTVQLTIARSELDVQQAAITFRSKVYSALADVEKSLSLRDTWEQQKRDAQLSLELSQQSVVLAKSQYLAGAVSMDDWLNAQNTLLSSESQLIDMQNSYLNATMQLWLALGGEPLDG